MCKCFDFAFRISFWFLFCYALFVLFCVVLYCLMHASVCISSSEALTPYVSVEAFVGRRRAAPQSLENSSSDHMPSRRFFVSISACSAFASNGGERAKIQREARFCTAAESPRLVETEREARITGANEASTLGEGKIL